MEAGAWVNSLGPPSLRKAHKDLVYNGMKINGMKARRPFVVNQKGGSINSLKDKRRVNERREVKAALKRVWI